MIKYLYFKPSGKYYAEGEGNPIPKEHWGEPITREILCRINNSEKLPGLNSKGLGFIIIIDDQESWPRLIYPVEQEAYEDVTRFAYQAKANAVMEVEEPNGD